ncbi:MAG: FecR domain-containing protein [Alphaproteobacteria bacterium]|nr:FecR domain-containing protein [Alphaproteobacteria bacterium]
MLRLLVSFFFLLSLPAHASVGEVTRLSGNAKAIRHGQDIPLSLHSAIEENDALVTEENAHLVVKLKDATELTVGARSRITVDRFVFDPKAETGNASIHISKGFFRFVSGKMPKENMRYTTPVAAIGIRGSEAFGEVKADGSTLVGMAECCVDVTTKGGKVSLDRPNTFSAATSAYTPPNLPTTCTGAWLQKTGRALGAAPGDHLYAYASTPLEALTQGIPSLELRYRFEHVEQEGFVRNADASTLRARLGYQTASYAGVNLTAELEQVMRLGSEHYNDGLNGNTQYPQVPDPDSLEISALSLAYEGEFPTHARLGRQRLAFDNQRFVGPANFRQDAKAFDALALTDFHIPGLTANYAYVESMGGNLPDDSPAGELESDSHLVNLAYDGFPGGRLVAYAYLLDIENNPAFSSQTYGLRYSGTTKLDGEWRLTTLLEHARQLDYANNPNDYSEPYWHLNLGLAWRGLEGSVGFESLGGNGVSAVQTPYGTGHSFNGSAERFIRRPGNGLDDVYLQAGYAPETGLPLLQGSQFTLVHHWFSAERGGVEYGTEWDAAARFPFQERYFLGLEYANYQARGFSVDTEVFWVVLGGKF